MRIYNINPFNQYFTGKRQDRNTVNQLKQDNPYDLNYINQRNISQAIENLSELPGEDNVNFLLDISENLKYTTNIDLGKNSYNDWQVKLNNAAKKSLSKSPQEIQEKLAQRIEKLSAKKSLTGEEQEILSLRDLILFQVDKKQLEQIENKNIKELNRNLDYFIISSEVPLSQKLYILKRLNYFISPEYEINPQLKDKKTQALAEIINDITINTPESKIPNIKSTNQKNHGMCAAISICRKNLAYEDKANFVDMILSELDNSKYLMIYDITKLGTKTKVPIHKTEIDFEYALQNGYRIIDTSAMYWMQAANTTSAVGEPVGEYLTFDKDNFDMFQDSHLLPNLEDELSGQQNYYRTLFKTKSVLEKYKKQAEKSKIADKIQINNSQKNIKTIQKITNNLNSILQEISPEISFNKLHKISSDLIKLEIPTSAKAENISDYRKDFLYIPNESDNAKLEKIKAFLSIALDNKDSNKLNQKAPEILTFVNTIHSLNKSKPNHIAARINRAEALYNAAAAYRTQYIFGLYIPERLHDLVVEMNIPDRETVIIKNMESLANKLEKGSLNPTIQTILSERFGVNNNKEKIIEALNTNKDAMTLITTQLLDDLFYSVLTVNRKHVLLNEIKNTRSEIEENSDKVLISQTANNLKITANKYKVLETLDKFIAKLESENCSEEEYISIYNKFGKKNQMLDFKEIYEKLENELFKEKNEDIIKGFNALHGLAPDAPIEETEDIFKKIGNQFNNISAITSNLQNALEITDENGDILNTVLLREIVTKKLENMGEIIPAKDLKKFQKRFNTINYKMTNTNGIHKKLKDLPKELTTFSKAEKETLNLIESKINGWYSHTTRLLELQYKLIKEPLEEINRQVGVKTGHNWVSPEGQSGLNSTQQIQIIEQMTDRPYYIETNGQLAVKKIKNSPYSGISGTSVDHKRPAMHAQYIVDIKPIKVGNTTKEALFHDNTWGPKEHANTWIDENGLSRTDYNNEYGGELGYITDEKYSNGKLLDNLFTEVGQTKEEYEEYKFPMLTDILTPGRNPLAGSFVRQIRQNTMLSPTMYLETLEKLAQSMTRNEVFTTINKTKNLGQNTYKKYLKIENRILSQEPLNKGINTLEDYNNLSDNDELKILLEKIALIKSFSGIPDSKIFYRKTTMAELNNMKSIIRKEAHKNFDYTFGKNSDITKYGTESVRNNLNTQLSQLAKENNFKLSLNQIINIVNSMNKISKEKFDGSLDTTINLMSDNFAKYLATHTPDFDNKNKKIEDIANNVRTMLRANMGFTLADLNKTSSAIRKWIDDAFAPSTDEEFVQIFRNLQNMTTKEFYSKYNSQITDEIMGIKPITGFDVLKQFKVLDESAMDSVFSMLFNEEFGYTTSMSKTIPSYDYTKTNRILRGAYYAKEGRSFDDIYIDYYFSLLSLNRHKQYDKLKTMAFKQYGMFPAYPKVDPDSKKDIEDMIQDFYNEISNSIEAIEAYKIQDQSFEIIEKIKKYSKKLDEKSPLSQRQEKYIKDLMAQFLEINGEDTSVKDTIDAGFKIMELDSSATGSDYKKLIDIMFNELKMFVTTADGKTMQDSVKATVTEIQNKRREFVMNIIEPKYQNKAYKLLDKWLSAKMKNNPNSDDYFADFEIFFEKHRLTKNPERLLNEYLLLLAQPDDNTRQYSEAEKKQLEDVKEIYKLNIKGLLFQANILEMQQILMNCAKEGNLNIVREEFKNSQIMLNDGRIVSLDSDEGLIIILDPLMRDEDIDTLVMFIEQLGLSERVIEMYTKNIKFDNVYKNIKRIDNILLSVSKQTEIVKKELDKLGNIDNDPDYIEKINQTKENIIKKFKNTNYRKSIKIVEEGFKNALAEIEKHPELSKTAYLHLFMENVKTATLYVATNQIDQLNLKLMAYQRIYDLLRNLKVRKDSYVLPYLEKYFEEVKKVEEFANQHTRDYKNLDLKTGNYALND
uniref:Uncharacterized protein n=1 Tax=uncultured Candidatus Melainabacteria bacterium TaxID=2682970 RepID=A0A650EJK6_9BACT|nr:hypothetical protein Melaina855_1230 [uncultured Candidatus Melainabacteria bacterium]